MGTFMRVFLVVFLAVVAQRVIRFILLLDLQKIVLHHEPGPCYLVPGMEEGSEDIQVLSNGIALITAGMRFPPPGNDHIKDRKGRIFKFDFNNPQAGTEEVKIINAAEMLDLNPHGISLWEDKKTGKISVFVVNHPVKDDADYICIFEYNVKSNTLRHLKSITHPSFGLLNDVVAFGPDSFYTTMFYYSRTSTLLQKAEAYLGIRLGSILYYDGQDVTAVDSGLLLPNGIVLSLDGKFVFVASCLDKAIKIYKRNSDNSLTFVKDIALPSLPDNLNIDKENGDIWIGAQPVVHQVISHMENPANPAASQVVRIQIQGDKEYVEEIFSDPGTRIFASSVAERYKDAMLVGTPQHKLLYCRLKPSSA